MAFLVFVFLVIALPFSTSCTVLLGDVVLVLDSPEEASSRPANGKMPRLVWNPKLRYHVTNARNCILP